MRLPAWKFFICLILVGITILAVVSISADTGLAAYSTMVNAGSPVCPAPLNTSFVKKTIPMSTFSKDSPGDEVLAKAEATIRRFTNTSLPGLHYTETMHEQYADLYNFEANGSHYSVNNITNRVQSAWWYETGSEKQEMVIDPERGYSIAESYTREKFPEFWNTSGTRGVKNIRDITHNSDIYRPFTYEWWEIYYAPDGAATSHPEIPGPNTVSAEVNPYTGHLISYSEFYTPSAVSGSAPSRQPDTIGDRKAGCSDR